MKQIQSVKLSCVATILLLAACSPKVETRGYIQQGNWKDEIKIGQTNKQEVLDKFGSPSSQSSFGAETWYYVSTRKEAVGFMRPSIVSQDTVDITFDPSGVVSDVHFYDKDDGKDVALVKRTTPTEGHSLSFIDQTLGNLGRFNKPGGSGDSPATGRKSPTNGGIF